MKFEKSETVIQPQQRNAELGHSTVGEQRAVANSVQEHCRQSNKSLVDSGILTNLSIAPEDKLLGFAEAAARRALNPNSYSSWFQAEQEKFIGIGEGLTNAKESTKAAVSSAAHAIANGDVLRFMAEPNAINKPLFGAIDKALTSAAQSPNALNDAVDAQVMAASKRYSAMAPREQGHVIGEVMFGMVNPEGSTEGLDTALRAADRMATKVDASVMSTIDASSSAIKKMHSALPELSQHAQSGFERLLTGSRTDLVPAYAGGNPGRFVDAVSEIPKNENVLAMVKADGGKFGFQKSVDAAGDEFEYQVDRYTKRLQRADNGEVRQAYNWPVINEKFDPNCIRQSHEGSCMSAVGEMLTGGKISEAQFLRKLGIPSSTEYLAKALGELTGDAWTDKNLVNTTISQLTKEGPICVELYEPGRTPHVVAVDGQASNGNVMIRDPQEGTSYEMTFQNFKTYYNSHIVYRKFD